MKKFLRISVRLTLAVLLLGVFWGAWYVNKKGFSRSWRDRVEVELLRHGVATDIRRITLDPVRGLVAHDVSIYRSAERVETLATISQVSLDLNVANLLRGVNFLNAVDLRHSSLRLPMPGGNGRTIDIDGLDARFAFPPGQIRVTHLELSVLGIDVAATGNLLMPEGYTPEFASGGGGGEPPAWLDPLLDTLADMEYPDGPPRIEIEFSGDLRTIESLRVEAATLRSGRLVAGSVRAASLAADLTYADKSLEVARLVIEDERGSLQAKASYSFENNTGEAQVLSTLDLQPLLARAIDLPAVRELTFFSEPRIEAFVTADMAREHPLKVIGSLSVDSFGVRSIVFDSLDAQLSWEGSNLFVRNLELVHKTGRLDAHLLMGESGVRVRATSTLDPRALVPLLDRSSIVLLNEWEFDQPPRVRIEGAGSSFGDLRLEGDLEIGRAAYRGVGLLGATSQLEIADKQVVYRDFHIRRDEGTGSGTFIYDFGRGEARLENIVSDMHPGEVAVWIDPEFVDDVLPYRFRKPARVVANGVVRLGGQKGTRLTLDIAGAEGMDYTFLGRDLPIEDVRGTLEVEDHTLKLRDFTGQLFGGDAELEAVISVDRAAPDYRCTIRLAGTDFRSITSLYFDYEDSEGKLNGEYAFRGRDTSPAAMVGEGRIEVLKGNVFEIPFLGPVSALLNSIVPGMGLSIADRAYASFTIRDGVITTRDLEVLSAGFTMTGGGDVKFIEDRLSFDIRINAKGLPGILLFPVSKLFEYTAQGTLDEPGWRPKLIPDVGGIRGAVPARARGR